MIDKRDRAIVRKAAALVASGDCYSPRRALYLSGADPFLVDCFYIDFLGEEYLDISLDQTFGEALTARVLALLTFAEINRGCQ